MNIPGRGNLAPEHLKAIAALAKEIDCPLEKVNDAYLSVLENYGAEVRIKDYLIVLVSREVRHMLRR